MPQNPFLGCPRLQFLMPLMDGFSSSTRHHMILARLGGVLAVATNVALGHFPAYYRTLSIHDTPTCVPWMNSMSFYLTISGDPAQLSIDEFRCKDRFFGLYGPLSTSSDLSMKNTYPVKCCSFALYLCYLHKVMESRDVRKPPPPPPPPWPCRKTTNN